MQIRTLDLLPSGFPEKSMKRSIFNTLEMNGSLFASLRRLIRKILSSTRALETVSMDLLPLEPVLAEDL